MIIGASKNRLGACYVRERDRAPLPPRTATFCSQCIIYNNTLIPGKQYITFSFFFFNSTHSSFSTLKNIATFCSQCII